MTKLDEIRIIISLQNLFLRTQHWDFCAYLRNLGRETDKDLYDKCFMEYQEGNREVMGSHYMEFGGIYTVDKFDLVDYNWALLVIERYRELNPNMVYNNNDIRMILDNNPQMWRNIKIDQIIGDSDQSG